MVVSVQTALSTGGFETGRANTWENRDDGDRSEFWPYLSEVVAAPSAERGSAVRSVPGNGRTADEIPSDSHRSLSAERMFGLNSAREFGEQGMADETRQGSRGIQSGAIMNSLNGLLSASTEESMQASEAEIASVASPLKASDSNADVFSSNARVTGQSKMSQESTITPMIATGAAVPAQPQSVFGATRKLQASPSLDATDANSASGSSTEAPVSSQSPELELDASTETGPALTPDKTSPEATISGATVTDEHQDITSSTTAESTRLSQQASDIAGADNQFQLADTPRADRLANPVQSSSAISDHMPRVLETIVAAARALGERPVELTLNPEELGRVRMTLHATDSGMAVQLTVERPETLDLLRRNIDLLAGDLRQMGYERLSFGFSNDQRQGSDPSPRPHLAGRMESETMMSQSPALPEPLRLSLGGDGLDLRI